MQENIQNIIGKESKCLEHRLVDVMGDDAAIVQAARVSYGQGTKTVNEDRGLIRYLMRHKHTSPFEMVELKFHVKLPIFIARQWIRHRTANVNEYSGRYSEMKDECYLPELEQIRLQAKNNKQGRADETLESNDAETVRDILSSGQTAAFADYKSMLDLGLAREIARINLPLSTYTEWYWKIDLHNLLHFIRLRLDSHAQYEIRVYAEAIAEMLKIIVPLTWEAFEDFTLYNINFSRKEIEVLKQIISEFPDNNLLEKHGLKSGEAREFLEKLEKLK
jgi:thymidylate synthase (FAD)